MSKGGKRMGSGRKKVGTVINIRIEEEILRILDNMEIGKSRAEKIRYCIKKGLEVYERGEFFNE